MNRIHLSMIVDLVLMCVAVDGVNIPHIERQHVCVRLIFIITRKRIELNAK